MVKKQIILFLLILLLPLVVAQPPFQSSTLSSRGVQIEVPIIDHIIQNEDFKFHIHTHNFSDGLLLDNNSIDFCTIHLYNKTSGGHIIEDNMSYDGNLIDWEYEILGGNFTDLGQHAILFYCEVSDEIGGFTEFPIYVSYSGTELHTGQAILYIILIFVFIGFFILVMHFKNVLPDSDESTGEEMISFMWLKYLRSTLMFVLYMLVVAILFITSNLAFAYLAEQLVAKVIFALYKICMSLTYPIVVVWFVWIFYNIFQDKKTKRLIEKGIFPQQKGGWF